MTTTDTVTTNPYEYLRIGTGFCTAQILLTALELDLFGTLRDGPLTNAQLCARLGLHPRGAGDFLDALVCLGLLVKDGGRYRNSLGAERHLVSGEPHYVGGFLERAHRMLYPAWGRFATALRTGEPQSEAGSGEPYDTMSADPVQLRSFLGMMDTMNAPLGVALADAFDWSGCRTVVDVGGARGNLMATVTTAHPHLRATVFDLPQVEPFFTEHMTRFDLGDRVSFRPGSFFTDPIPEADAVVIGHVLHDWAEGERRMLVEKAYLALRPDGALLVYDPMLNPDEPNLVNLVISLDMLLTTRGGAEYTPQDCRSWLTDAGFSIEATRSLGFSDTLVVGRKPA